MLGKRIIPRLDIKGENLVKGIHLEGLRVIGRSWEFAERYSASGADELLYMDAVASLYGRNSLHDILRKTAENVFIPISVGGGLRTLDDIRGVLLAGADKVVINTQAVQTPEFIRQAAEKYGSSTIAVSIQSKKQIDGTYKAYTSNGRENSGRDVVEWAQQAARLGAGEIVLISIDNDGTGRGFDLDIVSKVAQAVAVPVVCSGGAGELEDIQAVAPLVDGIGLASVLHYAYAGALSSSRQIDDGAFEIIQEQYSSRSNKLSIPQIKQFLHDRNIIVRPIEGWEKV